jgi:hypothetical protein
LRGSIRLWVADRRGVVGFVAGALVAASLAGGGVAIAAIPSTTTAKFNGCVNKDTAVLRVINYQTGKRCKKSEKGISWSQGWTYRGMWRAGTPYRPGDVVLDNGSSYVARAASLAKPPVTDASRWGLLASVGPQGTIGPPGPSGPVTLRYVYSASALVSNSEAATATVVCPAGLHAVNGGVDAEEVAPSGLSIIESSPTDSDGAGPLAFDGWTISVDNGFPGNVYYRAFAVCSSATDIG